MVLPQYLSNFGVERPKEFTPWTVTKRSGTFSRAHDISKQYRSEYALWFVRMMPARQKLLDLIQDNFAVTEPRRVVFAGKFNQLSPGDVPGQIACMLNIDEALRSTMQN